MSSITPSVEELTDLYVLDSISGFGPQKVKLLFESKISPREVLEDSSKLPISGKRGDLLRQQLRALDSAIRLECRQRAEKQLTIAGTTGSHILTYAKSHYPKHVFASNNPVPILYVRGSLAVIGTEKTVACVGSRKLRPPFEFLHAEFARAAVSAGFAVISGFALGADTVGHRAAVDAQGKTICVMPSGLDRPFPPENKELWRTFLDGFQATFVSEFPFGSGANSLNLRKRNKLIVAFAQGVLVSQSSAKGGAMNAYRFALEQKKPIATFRDDGTDDTSGNKLMAETTDTPATVFEQGPTAPAAYETWLQRLSS